MGGGGGDGVGWYQWHWGGERGKSHALIMKSVKERHLYEMFTSAAAVTTGHCQ